MAIKKLIQEYLDEAKLLQVATSRGKKPWVATVWYVHDDDFNFYFISKRMRRHSKEIETNQHVAGAIVKPHTEGSGQKVRGIQFEGFARACTQEEIAIAKELYEAKYEKAEQISLEDLANPKFIATYYRIKPKEIILFDEVNYPDSPQRKYILE